MTADELYALPLGDFTKARNDLARALAKDGRRDEAAEVKALPKPSLHSWALNQLAHYRPDDVQDLLLAGERLRSAQERALAGDAGELRAAARAEQQAAERLAEAAVRVLDEAGRAPGPTGYDRVLRTLKAAAVDEEARRLLEQGRLVTDLEAAGFGPVDQLVPAARVPDRQARVEAAREALDTARREADAHDALAEATAERAEQLAEEARQAADDARAARRRADEAAQRMAAAQAELELLGG